MEYNRDRGGYDTLLIPRSYNDITSNARLQAYAETAEVCAEAAAASEEAAATSETNAAASATLAESWAVGGTETRDGEDEDNSKYYAEQSAASAEAAAASEEAAASVATETATSVATETTTTLISDFEERMSSLEEGLSTQYAGIGAENNPVYFDADGAAVACISDEYYNTFLGVDAGATLISSIDEYLDDATSTVYCRYNTAVGYQALTNCTTGYSNTAVGMNALYVCTTGYSNTAVGMSALGALTTGSSNVAVGMSALGALTTGSSNVAVGQYTGVHTYDTTNGFTTASHCVAIGDEPYNSSSSSDSWYNARFVSGSLKGQLSVGMMKGLYFQAGTAYSTIYSALTGLISASSSSGTAYGVGCTGSYGSTYSIRSICRYSSTVYLYSGSGGTVLSITSSSSTIAYGLKLFFPATRAYY